MNPPAVGTPVAPQPVVTSPQGVGSVAPIAAPAPPALPAGQTPVATPPPIQAPNINVGQDLQNIAAYYQIPRDTARIASAGQAMGNVAQSQFEAQKYQNTLSIEHEKDQLDPTKYQFSKNADGSVTILNSVGDKVNIGTYAALTGDNPAEALQKAGATDAASEKFITAYNNLQTYVQEKIAAQNGDVQAQAAVNDFYKANPGLQNVELGQLQKSFMQQYGSFFGQSSQPSQYNQLGNTPNVTPTLTSQNNPVTSSAYENPNYQAAFQANQYQQQAGSIADQLTQLSGQTSQ